MLNIATIHIVVTHPNSNIVSGIVGALKENCIYMHEHLIKIPDLITLSSNLSPIKHLYVAEPMPRPQALNRLSGIVAYAMKEGVALAIAQYLNNEEHKLPPPSIRLVVTSVMTTDDMDRIFTVLKKACKNLVDCQ
ncbi:UNVERIFIED_CONTAM: Serine palmitoyltransferase 1 [Trichonephila clavipes]